MSKLRVNELDSRTGSTIEIASGANLKSSGSVVQVKHTTYGTTSNTSSTSYVDLCNIVITPKFANSSFFLLANFSWSGKGVLNLFRNSTQLHSHSTDPYVMWGMNQGSAWNSNSLRALISVTDYDSPTYTLGNSITYHVKYRARSASGDNNAGINEQTSGSTISNFTVMEIAQ
jgi:hypothetical protein